MFRNKELRLPISILSSFDLLRDCTPADKCLSYGQRYLKVFYSMQELLDGVRLQVMRTSTPGVVSSSLTIQRLRTSDSEQSVN